MTSHDDLRLSLGSYALGSLGSVERERVDVHLASCAGCRAELALLRPLPDLLALGLAGDGAPSEAPPSLEQRVLGDRRRLEDGTLPGSIDDRGRRERLAPLRWRTALVGAGALAGAALTAVILLATGAGPDGRPATTTVALRAVPGGPGGEATARVEAAETGSRVRLDASLRPTEGGQLYELWFVGPRGRVSAGTFRVGPDGRASADLGVAVGTADVGRIGITREPDAVDPARNGETVLSGELADPR